MTCVVVYADAHDKAFFDRLCEIIGEYIPSVTVWKSAVYSSCESPAILITDHESFKRIDMSPGIIIFGGTGKYDLSAIQGDNTVVIADSQNDMQLEYVYGTKLPAITCGLFARDTITLSSIESDSAVINLQRSITCFDGSVAEPQEIPVRFSRPVDSYLLMASAAVLILTGNSDCLAHAASIMV
ncbi:MAG: hypothetical protein FWH00_01775 [Oscillospiraceae bacterium]|nr:hypothetical protein [Oscillospiraceae bacterium]